MANNNDLTEYSWWGNENAPPENLKTKKQLAELGLKPVKAVGIIRARKFDCLLYDVNNQESVKPKRTPSEKQLKALEKGRNSQRLKSIYNKWYDGVGTHFNSRNSSIEWARDVLKNKQEYVIFDTESTGKSVVYDEIVQIGIINLDGKILLNTLIKPSIPISSEASTIHGITDDMVENAPSFDEIYPQISDILKGKKLITYNVDFHVTIFIEMCKKHGLNHQKLSKKEYCLMLIYARFYGVWSEKYGYISQALSHGVRSALQDCFSCLDLIKEMAAKETVNLDEAFENGYDFEPMDY
ncbi:MAG: 3'-5' exonuclease [Microcoleaceae cyanobacterium]